MTRRLLPRDRLVALPPGPLGLSTSEVLARRQLYGRNEILKAAGSHWKELAGDTARDPMIWFLVATGALYALLGQRLEAVTLLIAIAPLVGMDLFLHQRTRASTEGLSGRLAVQATVERDGRTAAIPAVEVVPGDLAIVTAGEWFPADGLIVSGEGLQVDESTLTGEAYPVRKSPLQGSAAEAADLPIDAQHLGAAGTRLLTGRAVLRVVLTGPETLYGEIARSATLGAHARTPLQVAIGRLVTILLLLAGLFCGVLALVRVRQGYGWGDALLSAITLAVAALPEEFPVVFTFFLGVGVYRLAHQQALVRRAVSVENIGRVTCICTDKTGTITEGTLRLCRLQPATGVPDDRLLQLAALASRREHGDLLDAAILSSARSRGIGPGAVATIGLFPFTEARRRETAIVRLPDGTRMAVTKGSLEAILALCRETQTDQESWTRRLEASAAECRKVIACAWKPMPGPAETEGGPEADLAEPDGEFRFAGLLEFEDPVRAGVREAIDQCRVGGIHPIMVTGDHPATALAVARSVGLGGPAPRVVTGEEIEPLLAAGAGVDFRSVDVVARAAPAQKLLLVRALQRAGEIVAVTGDGVNDVPALQAADVGIAMGERGTRSAREVASIVLLDDNFRTIVGAIGEGRQLFLNLQLSFMYLLMIHIPLVLTAALVPVAGYPLLYLPIHLVWLELIIHPTALLVFQALPDAQGLVPRRTGRAHFFSTREWVVLGLVGGVTTAFVLAGYARSLHGGGGVEHARAMALAVLALWSAFLTALLSRLRTGVARTITAMTILGTVALIQIPALARALRVQPLHRDDWLLASLGALAATLLVRTFGLGARRRS